MEEFDKVYWLKADKLLRKSSGVRICDEPTTNTKKYINTTTLQ